MSVSLVTVFGGTGFLGRVIVRRLLGEGMQVRVAVRHPEQAARIFGGDAAQIIPLSADVREPESVAEAIASAQAVVNAVGLYVERGPLTFNAIHVEGARNVAQQAAGHGIERLIHISGIGADASSASPYVRSRAEGEAQVMAVFPQATLLRPSAIFGPGDALLTVLIRLVRFVPVIPLFGQGTAHLQPVFVEDVAAAVLSAFKDPGTAGRTYELGGPKAYSYKELVALIVQQLNKKRLLLPIPFFLWELQTRLLSLLPEPPLTSDQLALLKHDNIVSGGNPTLHDLGITPTSVESKLPDYI